jgi:hypothetical protein
MPPTLVPVVRAPKAIQKQAACAVPEFPCRPFRYDARMMSR